MPGFLSKRSSWNCTKTQASFRKYLLELDDYNKLNGIISIIQIQSGEDKDPDGDYKTVDGRKKQIIPDDKSLLNINPNCLLQFNKMG